MPTDKQNYNKERYIDRLKKGKEAYQVRKDFLKNFTLKATKPISPGAKNVDGENFAGVANVKLNGNMPTISQYQGPDQYFDQKIGRVYQTGIKSKVAGTDKWNDEIIKQAGKAGVNPLLVKVIMAVESGGEHDPTPNGSGYVGLMQVGQGIASATGLSWATIKSDPASNIYAGCVELKQKHEYAQTVIKNAGSLYTKFKNMGYELKADVHGCAWLYNGFSVPTQTSDKVHTGGYVYANQIAAMYAGFGRNAHVDTALTLNVLQNGSAPSLNSSGSGSTNNSVAPSARSLAASSTSAQELELDTTPDYYLRDDYNFSYKVPIGSMKGDNFKAPSYIRARYIQDRKLSALFAEKDEYAPLPDNEFIHMGNIYENFYSPEARSAFISLKNRLGYRQVIVSRGYDPNLTGVETTHSIGIAMDIYAATPEEATLIADTAWLIGIRAIAIGPKFVHVDVGPEACWNYDRLPAYRGPNTIKAGELKDGFR